MESCTAIGDGYVQASGCVSAPGGGAMGIHFVRFDLIGDGVVDSTTPELLVYEPSRSGRLRLVAVGKNSMQGLSHGCV